MDIFTAIADPTRRSIVELLSAEGRLSATTISSNFTSSAPAISQHLKVLRMSNVVTVEKQSRQRLYAINPLAMQELETWAKRMADRWEERYQALDAVLEREKAKHPRKES